MVNGKIIFIFLYFFLIASFSGNSKCPSETVTEIAQRLPCLGSQISALSIEQTGGSFNQHTTKIFKTKVRYVAGECGFDAASFQMCILAPEFLADPASVRSCSFTPSAFYFLFKLRGPPATFC